ncbi:MAG: Lon protease family protein [Planctomycetota bacterium]
MTRPDPSSLPAAPEPLPPEELRWRCDGEGFPFEDTSEVEPIREIIGQERALGALQLGLELAAPGYNLFVCGLTGSGRTTTLQVHLRGTRPYCPMPRDRAYVFNFRDPQHPRLLTLARGRALPLAQELNQMVLALLRELPALLSSEKAQARLEALTEELEERKAAEKDAFKQSLAEDDLALMEVDQGDSVQAYLGASVEGFPRPLTAQEVEAAAAQGKIPQEPAARIREQMDDRQKELVDLVRGWRSTELKFLKELEEARKELCRPLTERLTGAIAASFEEDGVQGYLEELREDLLGEIPRFLEVAGERERPPEALTPELQAVFYRYRANVILDNSSREGCPVVVESQPTFTHLFGGVERPHGGEVDPAADFLFIRGGSILEADGGFLVLNARDLTREPAVWPRLKAILRDRELKIPETDAENRRLTTIQPEPIALNSKVVLVGSFELYQHFLEADPDFQQIFKVRVDFDREVELSEELVHGKVPALIQKICAEEELRPLDRGAVARVVEHMVRLSGRRDRLSTVFTHLADLVREAHYQASTGGKSVVTAEDVRRAIHCRNERVGLPEESIHRRLLDGTILVDVAGEAVGQINALVVRSLGDESFGQPVRITAQCGMGNEGVINIEREVGLSGETHDKGMQILTGFIRGRYTRDFPLSLSASICFEQSYGGVDGDSASATEAYALLSAISGVPLGQNLAVSGSMNQMGQIQAVGGLNEKIEGFYRLCRDRGFSGEQGVIIPRVCVPQLMLREELVDAVREGRFRVFAIDTFDEGLELLTGLPAGRRGPDGAFPEGTVHHAVETRLGALAEGLIRFRGGG